MGDKAYQVVLKATADDAREPSSFALKELAQISLNSERESAELFETLLKRLDSATAQVKYKTLKTLKYVTMNGRPEFRQELSRGGGANFIRNALNYQGVPDPLRGDVPNQKVRDEAKELMGVIFGHGNLAHDRQAAASSSSSRPLDNDPRIGAYPGARSQAAAGSQNGGARVTYDSISNSSYQPSAPPSSSSSPQSPNEYRGTYALPQDDRYGGMGSGGASVSRKPIRRPEGFQDYNAASSSSFSPPSSSVHGGMASGGGAHYAGHTHKAGEVGGSWGEASAGISGQAPSSAPQFSQHLSYSQASRMTAKSDGEYEGRLVDAITVPTGVRPIPTKDEMAKFVTQCQSLDQGIIAELLDVKLNADQPWQSSMKALCVLEALLERPESKAAIDAYISSHIGNIERLESSPTPQLKKKAIRILELCELREPEPSAYTSSSSASSAYASSTSSPANGHQSQGQVTDMFGQLSIGGVAQQQQQKPDFLAALSQAVDSQQAQFPPAASSSSSSSTTYPPASSYPPSSAPGGFSFIDEAVAPPAVAAPQNFDPLAVASPRNAAGTLAQKSTPSLDQLMSGNLPMGSTQKVDPFTMLMTSAKGTAPIRNPYGAAPAFASPAASPFSVYPPPPVDFEVKAKAAPQAANSSGFGFMSGAPAASTSGINAINTDSFNFVGDLMK